MPNTSSSVPFLLSSSMQSIRSRRPSAVFGGSQGSQGLLQQLGSGMVRLTSSHQPINSRTMCSSTVRKCPSLNITFSWTYVRMTELLKNSESHTYTLLCLIPPPPIHAKQSIYLCMFRHIMCIFIHLAGAIRIKHCFVTVRLCNWWFA